MSKDITLGDLRKAIQGLPDDLPLIYSHDDEGNEHQKVVFLPTIMYMRKTSDCRYLKVKDKDKNGDMTHCLCIN